MKVSPFIRQHWLAISLAFVAPLLIWYCTGRRQTSLRVALAADIPVVAIQQEWSKDIAILYRSAPVTSVRAIEVNVTNTGNQPIRSADWESALVVVLPRGTRVIASPIVTVRQPRQLLPRLTVNGPEIRLEPLLLNAGDSFTFRTLLADWTSAELPLAVRGRVTEVSEIQYGNDSRKPQGTGEKSASPWWGFGFIAGIVLLGPLIAAFDRMRIPGRMHALMAARRSLELTPEQRRIAGEVLATWEQSTEANRRMVQARSRVELQLRLVVARQGDFSWDKQISSPELVARLVKAGLVSRPLGTVLDAFLKVSKSLQAALWPWKNSEDYAVVASTGIEALAALSSVPSILEPEGDQLQQPIQELDRAREETTRVPES